MGINDYVIDKIDRKLERRKLEQYGITGNRIDQHLKLRRLEQDILYSLRDLSSWGINVKAPGKAMLNGLSRLQTSVLTENIHNLIIETEFKLILESIKQDFKFRKNAGFYLKELRKKHRPITNLGMIVYSALQHFSKYINFEEDIPNQIITNINRLVKAYMYLAQSIAEQEKISKKHKIKT